TCAQCVSPDPYTPKHLAEPILTSKPVPKHHPTRQRAREPHRGNLGTVTGLEQGAMNTKTLRQTVTFEASPLHVYDMLMDSKKHRSVSGEPAKISQRLGGPFKAGITHLGHQSRAEGWPKDRAGVACHADRHSSPPLQRSLPWMDRGTLDAHEGKVRTG